MKYPIPDSALDDRLGIVGMTGSGKTYGAGTAVEKILAKGRRVIISDPLGVWWGLRLNPDGKTASRFNVVIFGGEHGDIPITENAGALIGEAVAQMSESAIIDTSGFTTKASERRFMLRFLQALYAKANKEPVHVIFDEADLYAPQNPRDKSGGETGKLMAMMETVVRRGRVRGFTSWMITQRPAVVNNDIFMQIDGMICFKLVGAADREAVGRWLKGIDPTEGKRVYGEMAKLSQGQAIIWIAARDILTADFFPTKKTFDSSSTPKRGESRRNTTLKPLDIEALRGRLSSIEEEVKANDPRALKTEISKLRRELAKKADSSVTPEALKEAEERGFDKAFEMGVASLSSYDTAVHGVMSKIKHLIDGYMTDLHTPVFGATEGRAEGSQKLEDAGSAPWERMDRRRTDRLRRPANNPRSPTEGSESGSTLSGPQLKILKSLAWWKAMGHNTPTRAQIAAISGQSAKSGHFNNTVGKLRASGMIDYPESGKIELLPAGDAVAPEPDLSSTLIDSLNSVLSRPQRQVFDALLQHGGTMSRDEVAYACDWSASSGHFNNVLGKLRTLGVITYPEQGSVSLSDWVA